MGMASKMVHPAYHIPHSWIPSSVETLDYRVAISGLYGAKRCERLFKVEVPPGTETLSVRARDGTGNGDGVGLPNSSAVRDEVAHEGVSVEDTALSGGRSGLDHPSVEETTVPGKSR
jgi:hypothetical protein